MNKDANQRPYHLPANAVWFITGCSSGLGHALATYLLTHTSNRVVATARNPKPLVTTLPASDPSHLLTLALDVTSPAAIDAALQRTRDVFGRIDIVVNNAGYTLAGDTEAASDAEARALLDTNFWGMVDVSTRCLGIMRDVNGREGSQAPAQQGGVILNISSMGGWFGFPACSFYHASKFAMEGWTEAVAQELPAEWNIHLCLIEPGGVQTSFTGSSLRMMAARHPAYAAASTPTNVLLQHMRDPAARETWADPAAVAAAIYTLVSRGERIPIRVPLGRDAHAMILADLERTKDEVLALRELSCGVAREGVRTDY